MSIRISAIGSKNEHTESKICGIKLYSYTFFCGLLPYFCLL